MNQKIKEMAESFFEWPTENKSVVTLTSAILFAEKIAELKRGDIRDVIESIDMSLSACQKCGGNITLGPDATNRCETCGDFVFRKQKRSPVRPQW